MFKTLLQLDTIRGPHSTGVAALGRVGGAQMVKKLGTPWLLFKDKEFTELMRPNNNILMGHNRYATKGAINEANAHPFEFENLIGAHNGTLVAPHLLPGWPKYDVDSEALYDNLSANGLKHTVDRLDGAYALTWIDKTNDSMNFLRNSERELFYCTSEDNKTLYWASESWMLHVALGRNGVKYKNPVMFEEMFHYQFNIELGFSTMVGPLAKPKATKYVEYVAPQKNYGSYFGRYSQPQKSLPQKTHKEISKEEEMKALREVIGTEILFSPYKVVKGGHSVPYILGYQEGGLYSNVRIYCANRPDLFKELEGAIYSDEMFLFKATVRSFQRSPGDYLLLDPRTVENFDEENGNVDEEDVHDLFPVNDGVLVTKKEFLRMTSRGCAFCSSPSELEKSDKYVWIDSNDYICDGCKDHEEVKEFLPTKH